MRVAAIAIDATEWAVADRLMADGLLPRLAELRARSATCTLKNTVAYRSELPWTQFLTGRDPHANGYWSTEAFDPNTYVADCQGAYTGDPFYAGRPLKVVQFDVPHSCLSDSVDGLQVTAWGAHGPQYPRASLPLDLLDRIDDRWGPHPAFDNDFDLGWFSPAYIENLTAALLAGAGTRLDIARWLLEEQPDWDLFLTSMSEVHSAGHHFWHGIDPLHPLHDAPTSGLARERMLDVFARVDESVGAFLDDLPNDVAVLLFALHGMQPADDLPSMVLVPELLHRLHFGRGLFRDFGGGDGVWRRTGYPVIIPDSPHAWAVMDWIRSRFSDSPRDRALQAVRRVVPGSWYEAVRRATGRPPAYPMGELGEKIAPPCRLTPAEIKSGPVRKSIGWQPAAWYDRHWPKMRYFAVPTFTDAHIRINLRGRERDGIVDPRHYESVCDEVIAELSKITDPRTGEAAVQDVLRVRAYDPMDPLGPDADLLVVWRSAYDAIEHPATGIIGPVPFMRTGAHTPNGFLFAAGAGITPGDLGERPAEDLTPTVLELLGQPVPADLQGASMAGDLGLR